jgi:hypothetical protein
MGSIADTGLYKCSLTEDIEAVLRKIEHWNQGSIRSRLTKRKFNGPRLLASFQGAGVMRLVVEGFLDHSR